MICLICCDEKQVTPLATSWPELFTHWTMEPWSNSPLTSITPAGSRLFFIVVNALTAPSSMTRVPLCFPE